MEKAKGSCVRYYGPGDVRIEEAGPAPAPKPGQAVLRIEACAVCGTDIKSFVSGNPRIRPPQVMGHELCGVITALGEGVRGYREGQRVTMATTIGCGSCRYCLSGRTNLCRSAKAMGFDYPGAMAPWAVIPENAVAQGHLVDTGNLDPSVAALSEPLSCVINDMTRIPERAENVLILGLGPLGMLHAVCAGILGIGRVVCAEFPGRRFDLARELGLGTVLTPDAIDEGYRDLTGGEGFDLVVITAPSGEVQSKAPGYARKGGAVSYFASLPVGREMLNLNSRTVHYGELMLYGTSDSTVAHVQAAVGMLGDHTDRFRPLITHRMPFGDFHRAMEILKAGDGVKIVLTPGQ